MSAILDLPRTQTTSLAAIKKALKLALDEHVSVILSNVDWKTYDQFVQDTMDIAVNPRFYFDEENLFIIPLLPKHERVNYYLESLVSILTEEFKVDCIGLGSTTYQRADIEKGFEPDSCFYFKYEKQMRNKNKLDMSIDPAPELIIEVDTTSLSTGRQNIFAAFGVPEIWRYDGDKMQILKLENDRYAEIKNSLALPKVTPEKLTEFIQKSETLSRLEWIEDFRNWAKNA